MNTRRLILDKCVFGRSTRDLRRQDPGLLVPTLLPERLNTIEAHDAI